MADSLRPLLPFVGLGPHLVLYAVGILFALSIRRRHPLPSGLALAGLALKLVASLAQTGVGDYLTRASVDHGWDPSALSARMSALALASGFLHLVGLALIVAAVFAGRGITPAD